AIRTDDVALSDRLLSERVSRFRGCRLWQGQSRAVRRASGDVRRITQKMAYNSRFSAFCVRPAHQNAVSCLKSLAGIDLTRFEVFVVHVFVDQPQTGLRNGL
ncbi:hypothetical protein, partial [Acetobacter aceti]|uniref:hypothetical protein n=1 Tax=Acetobacter aceti TaxID=435 RepID=UPI001C60B0C6